MILLGCIVCKEGIKVDFTKIKIILDLKPPMNPKQVRVLLGHYRRSTKRLAYILWASLSASLTNSTRNPSAQEEKKHRGRY